MAGITKRFTPLLDRVLVQKFKPEAKTASGLFLPESAAKAPNYATVLAVGPGGRTREGQVMPMNVKVGDKVVVPEYGGMTLKFEDEEFQVFRDEDILGVLNEEERSKRALDLKRVDDRRNCFLPESAAKAPNYATVLAVGPGGRTRDGDILPMNVKVGDKVVVPEYGGMTLKFEDEEFQVFRDADIMGILNE
eukprot:CAMPEP_0194782706 /NCGR_PEP_ID=MMETSP0323_2-20130528/78833_1 /TAXON_ID=2866 ORGANISM="Crypthecodinium cohnii, Strain Seligo" /NCGR_SAMPLE_ID=MMETSP0323_2 /ASSEMBLY_ACC=CAM_ASM_000346 /LENGTH=191 /DNA_ID=CAMNT_0039721539 /DNA_START=71 /DNA_END=647 /DNA_ORIENTATION=+